MLQATVTTSHTAPVNQHVVNASEQKSVNANFVAEIPKEENKPNSFDAIREKHRKANEIWDYENPTFKKVSGVLCEDFHNDVKQCIDFKSTPFIEQWFGGFITSKKFAELPDEKKEETLWLYEITKKFWENLDNWAYELKAGYHQPDIDDILAPDFQPTNTQNRYPLKN